MRQYQIYFHRPSKTLRWIVLSSAVQLLSGCFFSSATVHQSQEPTLNSVDRNALQLRRQSMAPVRQWSMSGRMSLTTKDDAWTGKLQWQQLPLRYAIYFNAPTGQGAVRIQGDDEQVVLETADGQDNSTLYKVNNAIKIYPQAPCDGGAFLTPS